MRGIGCGVQGAECGVRGAECRVQSAEFMKSYRELAVWQEAKVYALNIYALLEKFPKFEQYALSDQLRRASVSIPSNIAEGFGRESHSDFAHFLAQARGSVYECETQLEIAIELGYINREDAIFEKSQSIANMLSAFIRRLRTSTTPKPFPAKR